MVYVKWLYTKIAGELFNFQKSGPFLSSTKCVKNTSEILIYLSNFLIYFLNINILIIKLLSYFININTLIIKFLLNFFDRVVFVQASNVT